MPELPEVENTRRYLIQAGLPGSTISSATITWAKTVKQPSLEDFVLGLLDRRITGVDRRGKYLLFPLDGGDARTPDTLILHLGMTGGLRVHPQSQPAPPMVRHTFSLDDGRELRFIDPRKFGHLWLTADPEQVLPTLKGFNSQALLGFFTSGILFRQPVPGVCVRAVAFPFGGDVQPLGYFIALFCKKWETGFGEYQCLVILITHFRQRCMHAVHGMHEPDGSEGRATVLQKQVIPIYRRQ